MNSNHILHSLAARQPGGLPTGSLAIDVVQENVFALKCAGKRVALVKWIADENDLGQNELRLARMFRGLERIPTPPLLFEQDEKGGVIAGWAWVEGLDLREADGIKNGFFTDAAQARQRLLELLQHIISGG